MKIHREIKRAAISVLLTAVLLAAVGLLTFTRVVQPKLRTAQTLRLIHDLEKAVGACHADHGTLPEGMPALLAALRGENPEKKNYLPVHVETRFADGRIDDAFGSPLTPLPGDPPPGFISSGPDRTPGTPDDLSRQDLATIFSRYPDFQAKQAPAAPAR